MTWEEAGLVVKNPVIRIILQNLAGHDVSVPKLQEIKKILEAPSVNEKDRVLKTVYVEADVKSRDTLLDFVRYCEDNPELRFWQALRNWSGQAFILFSNFAPHDFGKAGGTLEDTFYRKGK